MINRTIALLLLLLLTPFFCLFFFIVKFASKGSFIFRQQRLGKNNKKFIIYKIRTMKNEAEKYKSKYMSLNEADGPVFKIYNDPRYTKIGKFLAHTGLDELPQLINIIKGDMAFIGPRPLPIEEALCVPKKYKDRFSVLPGISSPWVIKGLHSLTFDQWMLLDLEYIKNKSLWKDFQISFYTIILVSKLIIRAVLFKNS